MRRRLTRAAAVVLGLILILGVAAGLYVRAQLRASLPQLDGTLPVPGLSAPVTVARDALGIPTIRGASREDVARALGVLHAQERFFEMDLSRRRAAGELSALVGPRAIVVDREIRPHRFRAEAQRAIATMEPKARAVLDAYTAGVNSGLNALRKPPFEYLVLRQAPKPWLPEDTLLVVLSMFITLQDYTGSYESTLATMTDVMPKPMVDLLAPDGTEWDSPIVGAAFSTPPIPGPDVYNLRARRMERRDRIRLKPPPPETSIPSALGSGLLALGFGRSDLGAGTANENDSAIGSNNWVVSGRLTTDGAPLVANDMHLAVRVPNTWYRASLEFPEPSGPLRLIGITLPGAPALVVGSNTHVAWGFTNTYADWSDLILLDVDPQDSTRYKTPGGWRKFDRYDEVIDIAGAPAEHVQVAWTIWGPVLDPDFRGRQRAMRWVAHDADRLAAVSSALENARSVDETFDAVNGLGAPGQNFVVADAQGHIGWTVYGSIPRRLGFDGRLPQSWADGKRGWNGYLSPTEYPRVRDPESGRIWTANARVVDGEMLTVLGDGNYEVGSRARIIRDRLMARKRFAPSDLLDIQLDTQASFLARWRDLALSTLTPAVIGDHRARTQFRTLVEQTWDGHASATSPGYRLTRMFREEVSDAVIAFVLSECYEADPSFDYRSVRRREGPIWKLVTEKPMHLLDPAYSDWNELLVAAVDRVIARTDADGGLSEPWSHSNITAYRHPLSSAIPLIGNRLDMPLQPMNGDLYTPSMHWGANAPSERMIVSPGREKDGIMHMPTGQSGHPLSPYYSNSHDAWVHGKATPFLPGATEHTLTLTP
ncbi:MAG TPA: penicillin acylase family protein [Vicinamibacterales bacterium]